MQTNLPGKAQTVARGELYALYIVVLHVESDTTVEFVTDNENVYKTYIAGPKNAKNSINCDLWGEIYTY